MQAYETQIVITDPERLVLTGLPFKVGQQVEVIIREKRQPLTKLELTTLEQLFARTQAVAEAEGITEEDITREIDAYRRGQ
jgi:hypothetical protein